MDSSGVYQTSINCTSPDETTCSIPVSELTASPYNLSSGDEINVRISGINSYGVGEEYTSTFSGFYGKPVAPTLSKNQDSASIVVSWDAQACDGANQVFSGSALIYEGTDTSTVFNISTTTVEEYDFQVLFIGQLGYSNLSDSTTFECDVTTCGPG